MVDKPIIIKVTLPVRINAVWKAITHANEMRNWYFDIETFIPEHGFEFHFYGENGDKKWLHLCKITEVDIPVKLEYTWRYDGFDGESTVRFELSETGNHTRLIFKHEDFEKIGPGFPFTKADFELGWNEIITVGLKNYLSNKNS